MKIQINFFDTNTGIVNGPNLACNNYYQYPELLEYNKVPLIEWDGISVFTDEQILQPYVDQVRSKWKIAWLYEPRCIKSEAYQNVHLVEDKFDYIFTHDENLINRGPKYKRMINDACWIYPEGNFNIYPKNKMTSMVISHKTFAPGHLFRHKIKAALNNEYGVDLWGFGGTYPFNDEPEQRLLPFKDYMFSVVVENDMLDNWYTEKINDCLVTGVVPVYWGCPNIDKYYDKEGIITFRSIDELKSILPTLNKELYTNKMKSIKTNFELAKTRISPDLWMYNNCYKPLTINGKL